MRILDWHKFARESWPWIAFAVFLAIIGALTTPTPNQTRHYVQDSELTTEGNWSVIHLFGRYSEGRAVFARNEGATAIAHLGSQVRVDSIKLRIYDYGGDKRNSISFSMGGESTSIEYGGARPGVKTIDVQFPNSTVGDHLKMTVSSLGQSSFLVDSMMLESGVGLDMARILTRSSILVLLALVLWLATALTTVPSVSSGSVLLSVDCFRGVGVLLVVALHATGYAGLPDLSGQPILNNVSRHGHYGVEIFYLISAYTLTMSLHSASQRGGGGLISHFWSRRVNRIVPTFAVVILLSLIFQDFLAGSLRDRNLMSVLNSFASMTFIFERDVLMAPIGHSVWWSISTEFQFYVLMPLIFFPLFTILSSRELQGWRVKGAIAATLGIVGILFTAYTRTALGDKTWLNYTLFFHFDVFLVGVALGLATLAIPKTEDTDPMTMPLRRKFFWMAVGAGAYILLIFAVAFSDVLGNLIALPDAFVPDRLSVVVVTALAVFVARTAEEQGARFEYFTWLRTLGLLSFLVYLLHVPAMQLATRLPVPSSLDASSDYYLWFVSVGLILAIIGSVMLHHLIERPSLKLNNLAKTNKIYLGMTSAFVFWVMISFLIALATN